MSSIKKVSGPIACSGYINPKKYKTKKQYKRVIQKKKQKKKKTIQNNSKKKSNYELSK